MPTPATYFDESEYWICLVAQMRARMDGVTGRC